MRRLFARIGALAKKAWRFVWRRQTLDATVFSTTITGTFWVMSKIVPPWLAALTVGVVLVHELGHLIVARRAGRTARLPFFIPLFYAVFGATYIDVKTNPDPAKAKEIALAGPMVGSISCLLFMAGAAYVGFMPGVYAGGWMFLSQIFSGTFGSDGRKYRRWHRELQVQTAGAAA